MVAAVFTNEFMSALGILFNMISPSAEHFEGLGLLTGSPGISAN